jgi:hypothetical protein
MTDYTFPDEQYSAYEYTISGGKGLFGANESITITRDGQNHLVGSYNGQKINGSIIDSFVHLQGFVFNGQ